MTSPDKLCLKTIHELLGAQFHIPAYQRGYRWTSIQVRDLLDDIWEFSQGHSFEQNAFYCLQPVVVLRKQEQWEVVDGQQRLTTLFIVLQYLEHEHLRRPLQDAYKAPLFELNYETRPQSKEFLSKLGQQGYEDNIDFFHIQKAYQTVQNWFQDKDYSDKNAFLGTLLAKPTDKRSVKVIWYDLSDECNQAQHAIDVFARINMGKIPLTNAELVKALFMQKSHFDEHLASIKQLQIAAEWDAIEKRLQEEGFWYFINKSDPKKTYSTRIEFIFDLIKEKPPGAETYYTFHKFHTDFRDGTSDIEKIWKEIKGYFLTFDEWFRDRELYHLIGYLVECGSSVGEIKKHSEKSNASKKQFKDYLKSRIRTTINSQIDKLEYGNKQIKQVLLLFNIQTLLSTQNADVRFPFDRYKKEKWDIEHIRSQTDKVITGAHRNEWLVDLLEFFTDSLSRDEEGLVAEITALLKSESIPENAFNNLYQRVENRFEDKEAGWEQGIGNLALLDAQTNRSYKNALFPVKRKRIIQNDMNGVFVPICTKNVFLKYYSSSIGDVMRWREKDAEDHLKAILTVLADYLPSQELKHGQ